MSNKQEVHNNQAEEINEQVGDQNVEQTKDEKEAKEEETADPIEELQAEIADLKDQNLRLYAEFENFRKRTAKERLELLGTANQELMDALVPVLDDFHRALKAEDNPVENDGIKLIIKKYENTLHAKGLKPMENTIGKDFDVETMEAITRIPAPDDSMKGKIIDEVERGYYLGTKILRYAKVVVGE